MPPWGVRNASQAQQAGQLLCSLHDDLSGHFRVDRTVVSVATWLSKGVSELLIGVQHGRFNVFAVRADNVVGHVILVRPSHGCADRNREGCRPKTEVVNLDLILSVRSVLSIRGGPRLAASR